jgi:hypothetical protein
MNFDIPSLLETLKREPTWTRKELSSMVLLKSPVKNVVLTLLPAGIEISSTQVNDTMTYKVLEGKLQFRIRNESVILDKGEQIMLNEKTRYQVDSLEESAFLLTSENTVHSPQHSRFSLNSITFTF